MSTHTCDTAKPRVCRTGADLLAGALVRSGIEFFFIEDHRDMNGICEALSGRDGVKVIRPVSDVSCVPMADACARYTGKPAVSITTGGGHCLNQIMGITTAWGDKSPVISIGIVADDRGGESPVFDRDRADLLSAFAPVTVFRARIQCLRDMDSLVRRAVRESQSGRGGAVHLEIPESLLDEEPGGEITAKPGNADDRPVSQEFHRLSGDPGLVSEAMRMLLGARRPIIFAGGGVVKSGAEMELHELAETAGIPLLSSLGAMDLLDPQSPCYVGPSSYLSGEAFHHAVAKADVCLAVGTCFSELDGFGLPPIWSKKIRFIQVNIDQGYIAMNPPADIAILADAREVLRQMISACPQKDTLPDYSKWVAALRKKNARHYSRISDEAEAHEKDRRNSKLHPFNAFKIIRDYLVDDNTIGVMDGGNTALWGGMIICAKGPRRFHFPTGMATLGVGIPMAIGLKAAAPEKKVMLVTGDGSFLFNVQELELLRRYNLPVLIVINNDSSWNMMRLGEVMINKAISAPLPPQDYSRVAGSFGIRAVRVSSLKEWDECAETVLKHDGPMVVEMITDRDVHPDSLVSFIRVELMGSLIPPWKKLRRIFQSELGLGRNTRNLLRYLLKTI